MPAARPRTLAEARAAAADDDDGLAAAWDTEAPSVGWRHALGPDAGQECGSCDAPMFRTGAHTAVVCVSGEHDRPVWAVSAEALERSAAYAAMLDRRANRSAATIADPAAERAKRAEADRAALELASRKGIMRDQLAALRADKRLHPESSGALDWFDREVTAAATDERLDELADLLPEYVRRRHWWQADPLDVLDIDADADDQYDDDDDDELDAPRRRELPMGTTPGYLAPDPDWRQHSDPATVAYYDRIGAGGPWRPGSYNEGPWCQMCRAAGQWRQATRMSALKDPRGEPVWAVCQQHDALSPAVNGSLR